MANENKDKKIITRNRIIFVAVLGVLVVTVILATIAYSKYVYQNQGQVQGETAAMICEMSVQECQDSVAIINPYCTVTVMNYLNNDITETDVNFTIDATPKGNYILPEFEWRNSQGRVIARSVNEYDANNQLIGRSAQFPLQSMGHATKEDKVYTIVFLNTGEMDITEIVKFDLHAVQAPQSN